MRFLFRMRHRRMKGFCDVLGCAFEPQTYVAFGLIQLQNWFRRGGVFDAEAIPEKSAQKSSAQPIRLSAPDAPKSIL